jgi:catechol 2,3-dioxygenase-like lactoylglutathione lyase family enzyme
MRFDRLLRFPSVRGGPMRNFVQVTPQLLVPGLAEALALFRDVLGFAVPFGTANYAYVEREGVAFRLLELPGVTAAPANRAQRSSYIDVRDVDGLYTELAPKLATLSPDDVEAPRDQHWGQREFAVRGPDRHFIVFGQAIANFEAD